MLSPALLVTTLSTLSRFPHPVDDQFATFILRRRSVKPEIDFGVEAILGRRGVERFMQWDVMATALMSAWSDE